MGGQPSNSTKRGLSSWFSRRQAPVAAGFVGGAGPANPPSCDQAQQFQVVDGQLVAGDQAVRTDAGVAFMEFAVAPDGDISTTFAYVGGTLHWYNDAFYNGEAGFCRDSSGQVYITFGPPDTRPAACTTASLVVYSGKSYPGD